MTNQEELLSAFREDRFKDFEKLLECRDIDVDHFYGEPDNGTLLDLASRPSEYEHEKYISKLIQTGAKLWRKDEDTGKLVIHDIFKHSNKYLVCGIWNDVYVLSRSGKHNGNVMKVSVEENDIEAIQRLARSYSLVHYEFFHGGPDSQDKILLRGSIDAVRMFIKYFDVDKEFQNDSQGRTVSCREMILQKYPELEAELPTRSPSELQEILFLYLEKGVPELFIRRIRDISTEILNYGKQKKSNKTYLHVACAHNYIDVVEALLKKDVLLNEVASCFVEFTHEVTPIMQAAFVGRFEIFNRLAYVGEVELQNVGGTGSVWHLVLRGMQFMQSLDVSTDGHRKILKLLPEVSRHVALGRLNIEHTDQSDRTALHYALKYNNEFAIKSLFRAGAKLRPVDQSLLTSISATIVESYFDDCIRSERDPTRMRDAEDSLIIFDNKIFTQLDLYSIATKSNGNFFGRFESVTGMRKLYKHPLTKSWLYLKWRHVRKYYYINLAFYLSFCLALNTYIFQIQGCLPSSSANFNGSESTDTANNRDTASIPCDVSLWLWPITLLLYIVLILRELFQFSVSIWEYFGIPENWLEMSMIVVIGFLFQNETDTHLAASAILMSWIGLFFLLGTQPSASIYVEMFKTAMASKFAKLLLLYSILVASFAYSFFILFRNKTSGHASSQNLTNVNTADLTNKNTINLWQDLQMSFFKSIIMMTGEFDAANLPLDSNFSYGHVFFMLFVFLVTMVLYNLLNGLAVSDTPTIVEDAEIVALLSRAKFISHIERLCNSNPFHHAFKCTRRAEQLGRDICCNKYSGDEISIDETASVHEANPIFETNLVYVNPTQRNKIEIDGKNLGKMPYTIVKQAEEIFVKRIRSKLAKDENQNSLTDVTKNNPSEQQFVNELVHQFSEQINNLNLEIDAKITARDEKLLQNVDQRFDKMMNESLNEQISALKLEINAKNAARDEKLLQNVDQRFDKMMNKVLDAVLQEVNLLKNMMTNLQLGRHGIE